LITHKLFTHDNDCLRPVSIRGDSAEQKTNQKSEIATGITMSSAVS